jgi:Flp pilus assembly protein TadG
MIDIESPGRREPNRKGIATVELAVCLPILVVLVLGSIEATSAIFLSTRLNAAAYEGARKVTAPARTSADGVTAATDALTQLHVTGGSVTITPNVVLTTATGTQITVTVSAPFASNSSIHPFIIGYSVGTISTRVVMIRQ